MVPGVCLRKKAFPGVQWVVGFQVRLEEQNQDCKVLTKLS